MQTRQTVRQQKVQAVRSQAQPAGTVASADPEESQAASEVESADDAHSDSPTQLLLQSIATAEEELPAQQEPLHPSRVRTKVQLYQSVEVEAMEKERKKATQRTQADTEGEGEPSSHSWVEGARVGEAKNPGPSKRRRRGKQQRNGAPQAQLQAQNTQSTHHGPWGPERRELGCDPTAHQAVGQGWPHQNQPGKGTSTRQNSVLGGASYQHTGPTPTSTSTSAAWGASRHDGQMSPTMRPPWAMPPANAQTNTNANGVNTANANAFAPNKWDRGKRCRHGVRCDVPFCPYDHGLPGGSQYTGLRYQKECKYGIQCEDVRCRYMHSPSVRNGTRQPPDATAAAGTAPAGQDRPCAWVAASS